MSPGYLEVTLGSPEPVRGEDVEEVRSSGGPGEIGVEVLLIVSGQEGDKVLFWSCGALHISATFREMSFSQGRQGKG